MPGTRTLVTAEQLPEIAGDRRMELVRGELVEMSPVGLPQVRVVGLLVSWLVPFVGERKLGIVGPELGCILSRNPDVVRAPDISFISAARLREANQEGFFDGAPDLAVEVVSPGDRAAEMQEKISEYLRAGTRLVLVADPRSKTVTAYRPSGEARLYSGDAVVSCEDILPGFSFRLADLFRPAELS